MKLLHIDSSISGDQSASRQISAAVVDRLKRENPSLEITYRDVAATPVPHHTEALQNLKMASAAQSGALNTGAVKVAGGKVTGDDAHRDLAVIDEALEEFLAADIVVVGAPMYNLGIPSQLKAWADTLAAPGRTFRYTEAGAEGLSGAKRIIVASSRGGIYSAPPMDGFEHQEKFLISWFGFLGVNNIEFVRAEGVNYGPEQRKVALDAALAEASTLKAA
ncbi:FMN-dependent NADH-azoreductase [Streptomyces phaeochromogenes]|uniref:FMN-dependent NADH-azoreductase n=1 Tax=Streptomyces phaeochromogenes TaxID=1923 RepID=UPI002DD7D03F|nr:NAD(P)H-dependent oxidoreductase [Streptomyces phaeochromogenes]WRZ34529.1 NAD(P)H-dependent oxidoreductase [Streptomyces phaeochromogenes]